MAVPAMVGYLVPGHGWNGRVRGLTRLGSPEAARDLALMSRILRRQEELLDGWTAAGGPGFDGRTRAALNELGLREDELTLPTSDLSGGQRKLVALMCCLEQDPDVLLLDEPETHLDAAANAASTRSTQARCEPSSAGGNQQSG